MKEKKAGDILFRYLKKTYSKMGKTYSEMFRSWERIAGQKLSEHSSIKELEKGTVIVETDHPAYMQMLQMKKGQILNKLQKAYPELDLKAIRFINSKKIVEKTISEPKKRKENPEELEKLLQKLKNAIKKDN